MSPPSEPRREASRAAVVLAFLTVYFVWGSTYLAIRVAIDTLPGFLMAGTRFVIAGTIVFLWGARGGERPTARAWAWAALLGALFFLGGNGGVVWGETRVPTGTSSLLVATMPLWLVLLEWLRPGGIRPSGAVLGGLGLGFAGLCVLLGTGTGDDAIDPLGASILVLGSFSWATGSLLSRSAPLPRSLALASGMEMIGGGVCLLLAGWAAGEGSAVRLDAISARSLAAFAYLVVFGSVVAFSAFTYLLAVSTPAQVSTYAYVNPVVAVALGAWLGNEPLTPRTLLGAAVIVLAVALVTAGGQRHRRRIATTIGTLEEAPAP